MNTVPKLLVIADDLTGASDTGVQFAKKGVSSFVFLNPEFDSFPPETEVVVINTESRHLPAEEAAQRVYTSTRRGAELNVPYFYKKTDSTLRGNLGAELAAFHQATGTRVLPFVPAFPELGRTTRDGVHYVFGVPISESAFGSDPLNPISRSHIATLLSEQTTIPARAFALRVAARIDPDFHGILVCDCEQTKELLELAERLFRREALRAAAGSAAFAQAMAEFLPLTAAPAKLESPRGPMLLVNGSVNERSLEQIGHPCTNSFARHRITPELLSGAIPVATLAGEIMNAIGTTQNNVLLQSVSSPGELSAFRQIPLPTGESLHRRVARITGELVQNLVSTGHFGTLTVFGGDTLNAIATASRWTGLVPETEVCPGVTVAHPAGSSLKVISKAGGFGEAGLIAQILSVLRQGRSD